MQKQSVSIIGASGYTGSELVRMLINHPHIYIRNLVAARAAGKDFKDVFSSFVAYDLPPIKKLEDVTFEEGEIVFCCLPHGTSQEVINGLPDYVKIIDLSADFRMHDIGLYEKTYGLKHQAPHLQEQAIYGLSELNRNKIQKARLIACPGCYPTSIILPLYPLIQQGLINPKNIIADSKSGTSGAGRADKQAFIYCEVNEDFRPYAIANHRHAPEIEHVLTDLTQTEVALTFTPHLVPMMRGIISTIYLDVKEGISRNTLKNALIKQYENENFVIVLEDDEIPSIKHVRASNYCVMNIFEDRIKNRMILVCAEDNLVKGSSGQAIQNMNIMMGWDEKLGLEIVPIFP